MLDDIEEVETRDCNDNSCCKEKSLPNIPMYSYEFTNVSNQDDENCEDKMESRKDMINKIRSLSFAVVELAEFLDTHNDNKKALMLHKEYTNALKDLKDKYQKKYGPLTIDFPCNKWRWIEEPWPWERGNF